MSHGLMTGMFWGGVLLSAFPVLLGVGILLYLLRNRRLERGRMNNSALQKLVR